MELGRTAVVLASTVVAAAGLALALQIDFDQRYPDLIAGPLALTAGSKIRDLLAGPIALLFGAVGFWLFTATSRTLRARRGGDYAGQFARQLVWWSVPAVAAGAGLLLETSIDMSIFLASAAGRRLPLVEPAAGLP